MNFENLMNDKYLKEAIKKLEIENLNPKSDDYFYLYFWTMILNSSLNINEIK